MSNEKTESNLPCTCLPEFLEEGNKCIKHGKAAQAAIEAPYPASPAEQKVAVMLTKGELWATLLLCHEPTENDSPEYRTMFAKLVKTWDWVERGGLDGSAN